MRSKLTIMVFSLILLASCVKHEDSKPGCEVKGTWMGTWSSNVQNGTWVCNAENFDTDLNGYVFVWFDLPSLENFGINFKGLLRDKHVSSKVNISGVTLNINGNIDTETSASGSFTVSAIGMSGTWQGAKMPELDVTVVDSFALDYENTYHLNLAIDTQRDHLYIVNNNEVKEYGYSGNYIRSFDVENSGSFCFDGNHLWFSNFSTGKIIETDTLGVPISEFTPPDFDNDAIMNDGDNLKLFSARSRKIYSVTKTGNLLSEQNYSHLMISGICKYLDKHLAIAMHLPGTIFTINSSGSPESAFKFTNGNCYGIAVDGDIIWCLVERYDFSSSSSSPPTTSVKLFKLKINS